MVLILDRPEIKPYRALLVILVFGFLWVWSNCSYWHTMLPNYCRGFGLWIDSIAKENAYIFFQEKNNSSLLFIRIKGNMFVTPCGHIHEKRALATKILFSLISKIQNVCNKYEKPPNNGINKNKIPSSIHPLQSPNDKED